ncbi:MULTISPECIES: hypothetical protein [Pseudomonas aeruginosa group]|uniref:hypothetical protein n=1 Tax=Pseudomonas aeruginosa group TaxID=136841 RepID=UPI000F5345B5|nr:hypothetical protein [Pseudomonas aeruginosa]MBG7123480.1 hypothetical protein [Pseudomonas aeruginosa]MCV3867398.1 hypothetical protein [Pseudomonas aeruginosa]MCV3929681.1 hypothetical protein [Pseudomonas aeruginosa]MDK2716884.1 hypothetical protein [Pseudomonas aeruginosa]NPT27410.1 hypothetical protein [Pseudomonas aeruginosa]
MNTELKFHYVAFLDILGFKAMVESEVKSGEGFFLRKLYNCHQKAKSIFESDPELSVIQFSDSIVISRPYSKCYFESFVERICMYQRYLLEEGLLCRGGVAVNQHFNDESFTFSAGLIDAYMVESTSAKYPRVVVSPDVVDLVFSEGGVSNSLIREDDGLYFVDYLGGCEEERVRLIPVVRSILNEVSGSASSSVREKGTWLASYCDAVWNTDFCPPRFIVA